MPKNCVFCFCAKWKVGLIFIYTFNVILFLHWTPIWNHLETKWSSVLVLAVKLLVAFRCVFGRGQTVWQPQTTCKTAVRHWLFALSCIISFRLWILPRLVSHLGILLLQEQPLHHIRHSLSTICKRCSFICLVIRVVTVLRHRSYHVKFRLVKIVAFPCVCEAWAPMVPHHNNCQSHCAKIFERWPRKTGSEESKAMQADTPSHLC